MRLYIDTNIFLHFRDFTELDWTEISGESEVTVVACSPVLRELDAKKADPRLGHRARRIVKDIKALHRGDKKLRAGAKFEANGDWVAPCDAPSGLDLSKVDHHIVALVRRSIDIGNLSQIVSDDVGMQITCQLHTVPFIELAESFRLSDYTDSPSESKKPRPSDQRPRAPKLRLIVVSCGSELIDAHPFQVLTTPVKPASDLPSLSQVMAKHPKEELSKWPQRPNDASNPIANSLAVQQHEAVLKYNQELDVFYQDYKDYLARYQVYANERSRCIEFDLWLTNDGTLSTHDISVTANLRDESIDMVAEIEEKDWNQEPEFPSLPKKPEILTRGFSASSFLRSLSPWYDSGSMQIPYIPSMQAIQSNRILSGVYARSNTERRHQFGARISKLRHRDQILLGSFGLRFIGTPRPLELHYEINDAETPEPTTGRLPLLVIEGKIAEDD